MLATLQVPELLCNEAAVSMTPFLRFYFVIVALSCLFFELVSCYIEQADFKFDILAL